MKMNEWTWFLSLKILQSFIQWANGEQDSIVQDTYLLRNMHKGYDPLWEIIWNFLEE